MKGPLYTRVILYPRNSWCRTKEGKTGGDATTVYRNWQGEVVVTTVLKLQGAPSAE